MTRRGGEGIEHEARRRIDFHWCVAGHDDAPAGSPVRGDCAFEPHLTVVVERARRFVEQPDRSGSQVETGEREPPSLTGGQPAARPVGYHLERQCGESPVDKRPRPAELDIVQRRPEGQGFARRQPRFDGILMADIVQPGPMRGDVGLDRLNAPEKTARGRRQQGGEEPQEAGFAAPIRPGQHERAARRQTERQACKDQALAAPAGEILGDQVRAKLGQRDRPVRSGAQKSGSGGEIRSRAATVDVLDRVRGLGDKPVRINLTHTIWGADWDFGLEKL